MNLAERVRLAGRYRYRVDVREEEGSAVVRDYVGQPKTFLYVDPPYLMKADGLYLNSMEWADHEFLAACLRDSEGWVITYDEDDRVPHELYAGLRCAAFGIKHTAAVQHIGKEYAVFSRELSIPDLNLLGYGARQIA